jgi:hypothetical protein
MLKLNRLVTENIHVLTVEHNFRGYISHSEFRRLQPSGI